MTTGITDAEFHAEWQKLALMCKALDSVDIAKLRKTVEMTETVGPILYPTEYRDGHKNLANQRRVLEAAEKLRTTFNAVLESEKV